MNAPRSGPDPVDGLHLALLQQRRDRLSKRAAGRAFGIQEGLQVLMAGIGITLLILAMRDPAHRPQHFAVGAVLVIQGVFLWFMARSMARSQLQQLDKQIESESRRADAPEIAAAAVAARELLLRDSR
jgi:hypothetical protein